MGWDRVRGHDAARQKLLAAFERGRAGHAYLFVGPPGVGKHLFANELAKGLLCDRPPRPFEGCDDCPPCAQVDAGTHPDVFAVRTPDDKNELVIEVMREFLGELSLKPTRGKWKVGVIEDADDLNDVSANVMLKTLEEPVPGTVMILLGSSAELQLATIRSRCQVVRFHPLPAAELKAVLAGRGVTDPARVERLVRLAGGSPGQALALADDAVAGFRETLLAAVTAAKPDPFALAAEWGKFVEDAGKESASQRERAALAVRLLADMLRSALRLAVGSEAGSDPVEAEMLGRLASRLGPDRLADVLDACADADYHIDRRVQLALIGESIADRVCRAG